MSDQTIRARAPLRISFAGGGTEISPYIEEHGGLVLNATISLYATAIITTCDLGFAMFVATDTGDTIRFPVDEALSDSNPLKLHYAVYRYMVEQFSNGIAPSITVTTFCDAPPGSGLGSSSTLTVAMIGAFNRYLHLHLDQYQVAAIAFDIERKKLGLLGGHQDQYAASFGGFNLIEFSMCGNVVVNSLNIPAAVVRELESSLVLYFTGKSRSSANIIAEQSKNLSLHDSGAVESLHQIKNLVGKMRHALVAGDIPLLGKLLDASWSIKKSTASSITNSQIEELYSLAIKSGAIGGKITGAGGGGFMMLIVEPIRKLEVIRQLTAGGGYVLPVAFTSDGVSAWRVGHSASGGNNLRKLISN